MSLILLENKLLIKDGKLATSTDCCCNFECHDCATLMAHFQGVALTISGLADYTTIYENRCECCTATNPPLGCVSSLITGDAVIHNLCSNINGSYGMLFEPIDPLNPGFGGELVCDLAEGNCADPGTDIGYLTCASPQPPCLDPESTITWHLIGLKSFVHCILDYNGDGYVYIGCPQILDGVTLSNEDNPCYELESSAVVDDTCCNHVGCYSNFYIPIKDFCSGKPTTIPFEQWDCKYQYVVSTGTFSITPILQA